MVKTINNLPLNKKLKVVIVMPAFNAAQTIHDTFYEIPLYLRKNIILVDDSSTDKTVEVAKKLGIKVIEHTNNLGYGGNQKTCYKEALKLNPDIVVMLHPDYQYDASMIEDLIFPITRGRYDFMFGSRIANKKGAIEGGMPPLKYYVNRIVCLIQNILLGVNFTEHFSGFRAYSRKVLENVTFEKFSNDFVFDQEMTISSLSHGFLIGEIAIPTRYHKKASSIQFLKGVKFILEGFLVILMLFLHNLGLINDSRFTPLGSVPSVSKSHLLILAAFTLINLILYGVFQYAFFFAILLLFESILLYLILINKNTPIRILFFILLAFLIIISLNKGFDKSLIYLSALEKDTLISRQDHFGRELGKLYQNRFGVIYFGEVRPILVKFNGNLFSHLDFNLFFNLKNAVSLIFLSLFSLGIYNLASKINKTLIFSLIIVFIAGGFLVPKGLYGYLLYAPFLNLTIFMGLLNLLKLKQYVKV